jgi:beta-glucosidase
MPIRELRGFSRIHLAPGARQRVSFRVTRKDLAYFDESAKRFVTAPGEYEMAAGRSSADLPVTARVRVP